MEYILLNLLSFLIHPITTQAQYISYITVIFTGVKMQKGKLIREMQILIKGQKVKHFPWLTIEMLIFFAWLFSLNSFLPTVRFN